MSVRVQNTPVVIVSLVLAGLLMVVITILLRLFGALDRAFGKLGIVGVGALVEHVSVFLVTVFVLAAVVIIGIAAYSTREEE